MASAGGSGAFASAGNALAQAFAGATGGTGNMLAHQPFEPIPRAQGPFRSCQDNQEPIYDNSGIKIGADFGSPGDTVTMQDVEEGKKPKGRRRTSRLHRHISTAIALAGDRPEWVNAFLHEFRQLFGDMILNLTVNSMLDGTTIHKSQQRFMLKKVSVFA
jgi:hypothetical protein